jgi:hypothetical protein
MTNLTPGNCWRRNHWEGDDVGSSDRFYHWGALLGLISYLEQQDLDSKALH